MTIDLASDLVLAMRAGRMDRSALEAWLVASGWTAAGPYWWDPQDQQPLLLRQAVETLYSRFTHPEGAP